ncbi:hypothetical protein RNZ50_16540 [Paracoccaceae bacterium Fryx2]|nr:hypothetical protein [Paracoccaceae bacterium Fryx2]
MRAALTPVPRRTRLLRVALLAACLVLPGPGWTQAVPGPDDLRALIYYLGASDSASTDAELRRLRAQFPGWVPPANLSDLTRAGQGPDTDAIYRRIAANDLAGARAAITAAQGAFPGWSPPQDMLRLMAITEAQAGFNAAIAQRNVSAALAVTRANPDLLRCERVNNAWQLAEIQAGQGGAAAALATYRAVIAACTGFSEVSASLEKARAVASDAEMTALLATARSRFPGNATAIDALERRLTGRAPVAGATTTARPTVAAPTAAPTVAPTAAAPTVAAPRVAASPGVLAAPTGSGAAPRGLSRLSGLPRSGDGRLGQVRASAKSGAFADCVARSTRPRSLDLAYERAWCVFNLDRPLEALALFAAAAEGGLGAEVTRDARFGMALSYLNRNMTEEAARLAASTPFTLEQRKDVEGIILDQRGVRAYQLKEYRRAIAFFDALETLKGSLRRDLGILRAYSYLSLDERGTAFKLFEAMHKELATAETRAGMAASR